MSRKLPELLRKLTPPVWTLPCLDRVCVRAAFASPAGFGMFLDGLGVFSEAFGLFLDGFRLLLDGFEVILCGL